MISGIYNKVLKATCSSVTKRQLTCANEDELNCLSSTDGKILWRREQKEETAWDSEHLEESSD